MSRFDEPIVGHEHYERDSKESNVIAQRGRRSQQNILYIGRTRSNRRGRRVQEARKSFKRIFHATEESRI